VVKQSMTVFSQAKLIVYFEKLLAKSTLPRCVFTDMFCKPLYKKWENHKGSNR